MAAHQNIKAPDTGVIESDLFIYDEADPGTGALLANIQPDVLPQRDTILVKTDDLQITFRMNRDKNSALVTLVRASEPADSHFQTILLVEDFQTKPKVPITILFSRWRIVRVIDGKPLPILDQD